MHEVAERRPLRVAENVHVVAGRAGCYAAIVTEVKRSGAGVQFFLPKGARVPWPGQTHPYDPSGDGPGTIHRIEECPK